MSRRAQPTLRDVAREAGVSTSIASRVLNADPDVRARHETRSRIFEVAQQLNYVPHTLARSLRGARTGAIGLIMHGLHSPINVDVLTGARSYCAQEGYVTLLAEAEELAADDSQLRNFLGRGRLDGVIFHGGYGETDVLFDAIAPSIPAVLMNANSGQAVPTVRIDDEAAGYVATNHLMQLGHQEIAFIAGPQGSQTSERREEGYRKSLAVRTLASDVIYAGWEPAAGREAVRQLLQRGRTPTGLVVVNAMTAAGVLTELNESGFQVPDDISVVTVHDSWFNEHLSTPLTSVRLSLRELGETAARVLLEKLDGGSPPQDTSIANPAPELVKRSSTAVPGSQGAS